MLELITTIPLAEWLRHLVRLTSNNRMTKSGNRSKQGQCEHYANNHYYKSTPDRTGHNKTLLIHTADLNEASNVI